MYQEIDALQSLLVSTTDELNEKSKKLLDLESEILETIDNLKEVTEALEQVEKEHESLKKELGYIHIDLSSGDPELTNESLLHFSVDQLIEGLKGKDLDEVLEHFVYSKQGLFVVYCDNLKTRMAFEDLLIKFESEHLFTQIIKNNY